MQFTTTTLVLGALAVVAGAVGLLLVIQRPSITRRSVFAALPWLVTGAVLHALYWSVDYPDLVEPMLRSPWAYVLLATVGGMAWTLLTQLTSTHETPAAVARYFGLMGLGVLLPPLVLLIIEAGLASPTGLMVWVAIPVAAMVVTYVLVFSLGIWLPNPVYFAGVTGAAVIFGVVVDGLATALSLGLGTRVASPALLALTELVAQFGPVTAPLALVGLTLWLRLIAGIAVLVVLEFVERSHPVLAERGLKVATVASVVLSANTVMVALAGGWFA